MLHATLLFLHLAAAVLWVGGMAFAHFCLRPAAVELLQPPQRLPLMAKALGRFFPLVAVAVLMILVTGFWMWMRAAGGMARAPIGWHVMLGLGVVMAIVFAYIYARLHPALRKHVDAQQWPQAGGVLNRIRMLVSLNLVLGVLTIAAAASARA
jgi:uncharacterized membrane protein